MDIIKEMLQELVWNQAFEIQKRPDAEDIYDVPYMLNDALECYLVFTGAAMQGEYQDEPEAECDLEFVEEEERKCLIIRQGEQNTCTLWFEEVHRELSLYRFHEIGHFWEPGAEQWRRLVYIIGTMEDKYLFMGEEACNEQELELIPLIQFTPFYRYYPAKICIPEEYVMTEEGCRCMLKLAEEAGDKVYGAVIRLYLRFPLAFLERWMHRSLMNVRRGKLYDLIFEKAAAASRRYPERDYGAAKNQIRQKQRAVLGEKFLALGYKGTYPDYQKESIHIQVTEEHPFTRMESFEKGFRFHLMVSEYTECMTGYNRGFFRGKGLKAYICTPEEFFE